MIFLIGPMGVGKTSVGRLLASNLKFSFIDLDIYLEDRYQLSINNIFKLHGEKYFRELEHECLQDIIKKYLARDIIIATGGGIVESGDNIQLLQKYKDNIKVFYLSADIKNISTRLSNNIEKSKRPLISNIDELIAKREPLYSKLCDVTIDSNYKSIVEVVDIVKAKM